VLTAVMGLATAHLPAGYTPANLQWALAEDAVASVERPRINQSSDDAAGLAVANAYRSKVAVLNLTVLKSPCGAHRRLRSASD
jgi:hypothetical protein